MCYPKRLERGGPSWLLKLKWMGTQRVQMKGDPSLVGSLGLSCRYKRFLFCLGWSSRRSTTKFFLTVHYFYLSVPNAQQAGQAAVLGRLSLTMCLWCQSLSWSWWWRCPDFLHFLARTSNLRTAKPGWDFQLNIARLVKRGFMNSVLCRARWQKWQGSAI